MASPSPNPKSSDEGGPEETPSPSSPATRTASIPFVTTPDSQLPTKLQYVPLGAPGPSGIKQCFRTVKQVRRVPTLGLPASARSASAPNYSRASGTCKRSEKGKKYGCTSCDKCFSSPGKLQQHQLSHTGELPFSCHLCDKKFNSKFKLGRHMSIHSESRAFACTVCGRKFNRKDHLNNHARVHNPVKKLHTCERPGCNKEYTSLLSYRKHMALHTAEDGCLSCEICGDSFETRDEIIYHLKVHTGSRTVKSDTDKKFTCSYCGRRFFTGKDVRRHLVVHTGRRDFLCPFCPQKFGRKDHLVRHVKNAHPDESWRPNTTVSTSHEAEVQSKLDIKEEPKLDIKEEEITFIDFPLDSAQLEALLKPEAESQPGPSGVRTRVPSSDIIVEIPAQDIKEEPLEEENLSPGSSSSHDPLLEYPGQMMYLIPPPPPPPYPELELVDPAAVESLLGGPGSGTGEQLIQLLEDESYSQPQVSQQPHSTPLPAFTQAFQSAQSPKPPQPPPPAL